jgi:SpoVK/Ycf46/Vps4 family AAA+-type ATPase
MAGMSIIKTENPSVDFSDYVGCEELKEWIKKKVFGDKILAEAHGIEPPNGILLHGPSGVGKSYFTRCVAGEFNMPHARLSVSPSLRRG